MTKIVLYFIVFANLFFLLANLSKVSFATNPGTLSFFGAILNVVTLSFFAPEMYRQWRAFRKEN